MINDIIELIKLAREMLEKKREFEKEFFQNYVEPAWQLFQKIHKDYKDSFLEYSNYVSGSNIDIDYLINKVRRDSILSVDFRYELFAVVGVLRNSNLAKTQDPVISFLESISDYFEPISNRKFNAKRLKNGEVILSYEVPHENSLLLHNTRTQEIKKRDKNSNGKLIFGDLTELTIEGSTFINRVRYGVIIRLSRNKNEIDSKELSDFFEIIIRELQNRFISVSRNYYQIRDEFLSGV